MGQLVSFKKGTILINFMPSLGFKVGDLREGVRMSQSEYVKIMIT